MKHIENKIIRYKKEPYKVIKTFPGGFYMVQNIKQDSYIELVLHKDIASCQVLSGEGIVTHESP